jgi:rhodanese-related sulfurtransferase
MIFSKMKIFYLLFICVITTHLSDYKQTNAEKCFKNINCDDFNLLIETTDVLIIDVRLLREFRKERIAGAVLASGREALQQLLDEIDKNTKIMIYCEQGDRSLIASEIICKELKFKNVYNLEDGIIQWKIKGYPIDRKRINSYE